MISVVIPVFNSEKTIEACIQSVVNQTAQCFIEIVIADDGSTDRSVAIARNLIPTLPSNRTINIFSKENGGVSSARNLGIQHSSQEWVALLDSDDQWIAEKIEIQLSAVNKDSSINFLGTNFNDLYYFGMKTKGPNIFTLSPFQVLLKWWPYTSSMLIKRSSLEKYNIIFDESMRRGEDGRFLLQLSRNYKIYVLNISTVYAGNGKRTFGEAGLSQDLEKMYRGEIQNLIFAKEKLNFNLAQFAFLYLWLQFKYLRRMFIVKAT